MNAKLLRTALFTGSAILALAIIFAIAVPLSHAAPSHAHPQLVRKTPHQPITSGPVHNDRSRRAHQPKGPTTFNMTYHGGPVMRTTSTAYLIFWEPPTLQDGTPATVSSNYHTLLQRYFNDVGGNRLYGINTQYSDGGGNIINSSTLGGMWVDTTAYPASGCTDSATPGDCLTFGQLQSEVATAIATNGWSGGINNEFYLYTANGEGSCDSGGCFITDYCAYHTYYTSGATTYLWANMPYNGTVLSACSATSASPNSDPASDAEISTTSHEQMETVTDPTFGGWFGPGGGSDEIGDKCAYNYGSLGFDSGQANEEWNGHFYLTQMEWSNAITGCAQGLGPKITPTVTVQALPNPGQLGVSVALKATVAGGSGNPDPTGDVSFYDGTTLLTSTASLVSSGGGSAVAEDDVTFFGNPGTHVITAKYADDTNYNGASGSTNLVLIKGTAMVTLSHSPSRAVLGQQQILTISVAGSPFTPTGTVTVIDATSSGGPSGHPTSTTIGTFTLNSSGQVVIKYTFVAVGTHTITMQYHGDSEYNAATGTQSLYVYYHA